MFEKTLFQAGAIWRIWLLIIPFCYALSASSVSANELMWRYTVRPGDSLIKLARMHLQNPNQWKEIQAANHLKNPHNVPIGTVLNIPIRLVKFQAAQAKVISVSGKCLYENTDKSISTLQVGQMLPAGATLVTNENSKLSIQFADGSVTEMNSNAILILDTLSLYSGGAMVDTKMRLQKGRVETRANPNHINSHMEVITPSAIAAVRGTQFRVSTDATVTHQETLDGAVGLSVAQNEVMVNKGYGSVAKEGQPPLQPVVLLPAISTSQLPKRVASFPFSMPLPMLDGAKAWEGVVASDASFHQVVLEAASTSQELAIKDLPNGHYFLKIHALDTLNLAGYDAVHAFDVTARPFSPILESPINSSVVREPKPMLKWLPATGAKKYVLEIASEKQFLSKVMAITTEQEMFSPSFALPEGHYFWRVASVEINATGKASLGPFSDTEQFILTSPPPAPDLSNCKVEVINNRVFVQLTPAISTYRYHATLSNEKNNQLLVWAGTFLPNSFDFLLKEFGKQTLKIQYIDTDGTLGKASQYEFYAYPN
jgi:hypothetical protein